MSAYETPRFVVPDANLIPVNPYPGTLYDIPPSRMFLIEKSLANYVEKMGQSAFPTPPGRT